MYSDYNQYHVAGIAKLEFTEKKEIVGMISSEGETVPFDITIVPADAKGMVEKWLIQVTVFPRPFFILHCFQFVNNDHELALIGNKFQFFFSKVCAFNR